MALATARASLEPAVAALFSAPSSEADSPADCARCGRALGPPAAWRALRDVPVCWRWVLAKWRVLADSKAPLRRASRSRAAIESRASSMARLCSALYQCGIVASEDSDDSEVLTAMVQAATADGLSMDVVTRVLCSRALAVRVRVKLFQYAVSGACAMDANWVAEAATALQEELRQASVDPNARAPLDVKKSRKRRRNATAEDSTSASCERCDEDGRSKVSARESAVRALSKWVATHEADTEASALEAVRGLIRVLNAPDLCKFYQRMSASRRTDRLCGFARKTARSHKTTFLWEDCDKVVDELCTAESASMWLLMWRRERRRIDAAGSKESPSELVKVCAIADQFVYSTTPSRGKTTSEVPTMGLRIIRAVLTHSTRHLVSTLQSISEASAASPLEANVRFNKRHLFIGYARFLLANCGAMTIGSPESRDQSNLHSRQVTFHGNKLTELLEGLQSVYSVVCGQAALTDMSCAGAFELFDLWFEVFHRLSTDCVDHSPLWSAFLDSVAQCCEELKARSSPLVRCFEAFSAEVIVRIIASNGARLSSPLGSTVILVPEAEACMDTLQTLISMILGAWASSNAVITILYRLCGSLAGGPDSNFSRLGSSIRRIFLPALRAFLGESADHSLSILICAVFSRVQGQMTTPILSRALVQLLFEWDLYCETQSRDAVKGSTPESCERRSGMKLAVDLGVWQELIQYYNSKPNKMSGETADFQNYTIELLRSVNPSTCPAQLEGALFSVLAAGSINAPQHAPIARHSLIHHSDSTIDRFIRMFDTLPDSHLCGELVAHLKCESKLEDLVLTLHRWLEIIAVKPGVLPIETQNKLVLFTNRITFWGGSECNILRTVLVPVDPTLISAVQLYARPHSVSPSLSQTPAVSIVRLTVMIRSYLARSVPPDLVGLTAVLASAIMSSASASSRDGLLKLVHGFANFLIIPVLQGIVRDSLLQIGDRSNSRNARNALALIKQMAKPLAISISCDVFSVTTGELCIASFLHVALIPSDASHRSKNPIFALLECIEFLLCSGEGNESVGHGDCRPPIGLRNAYALAATFSSVDLALSIIGIDSPLRQNVARIHDDLLSVVELPDGHGVTESIHKGQRLIVISQKAQEPSPSTSIQDLPSGILHVSDRDGSAYIDEWRILDEGMEYVSATFGSDVFREPFRLFLPFSSWLRSVFKLPCFGDPAMMETEAVNVLEIVFSEMVLHFYLPIEFSENGAALTTEWLSVWIDESLKRESTIRLLRSQRTILLEQVSSSNPWSHLLRCTQSLITHGDSGRRIMHDISQVLDFVTLCSTQPVDPMGFSSMADDVVYALEKSNHLIGAADPTNTIEAMATLLEVFVIIAMSSIAVSPEMSLLDDVKRVGGHIKSLLVSSESTRGWWAAQISGWKRLHSHRCRRLGAQVLSALSL